MSVGSVFRNDSLLNESTKMMIPFIAKCFLRRRVYLEGGNKCMPDWSVLRLLQYGDPATHVAHLSLATMILLVGYGRNGAIELVDSFYEGETGATFLQSATMPETASFLGCIFVGGTGATFRGRSNRSCESGIMRMMVGYRFGRKGCIGRSLGTDVIR